MNDDDVREALGVRPVCRRINKIIHECSWCKYVFGINEHHISQVNDESNRVLSELGIDVRKATLSTPKSSTVSLTFRKTFLQRVSVL